MNSGNGDRRTVDQRNKINANTTFVTILMQRDIHHNLFTALRAHSPFEDFLLHGAAGLALLDFLRDESDGAGHEDREAQHHDHR